MPGTREIEDAHLCGRRLHEEMLYWETADENPSAAEHEREFARIWKQLPKIVLSKTLEQVEGNARLATRGAAEEVAELKAQPGKDLAVGGAGLAATLTKLGLIDGYRLFVSPVVLGGARGSSWRWRSGSTSSWPRRGLSAPASSSCAPARGGMTPR